MHSSWQQQMDFTRANPDCKTINAFFLPRFNEGNCTVSKCFATSLENMVTKEISTLVGSRRKKEYLTIKKMKNCYLKDRKSHFSDGQSTIVKKV